MLLQKLAQKRTDSSGITKQSKPAEFPVPLNYCTENFTCKIVGRDHGQTKFSWLTFQTSGNRKNRKDYIITQIYPLSFIF